VLSVRLEDLLTRNAANLAGRVALTDQRRQVDHVALLAESRRLAAALQRRGLAPGDRVAVVAPNRIEFVAAAFACFAAGLVFQPINFRLSSAELTAVLDDARPTAALVDAAAFPDHAAVVARRADLRGLAFIGETGGRYDLADGDRGLPDPDDFRAPAAPGSTAALLYTGGTTGRPKGTVLSHHAWLHAARDGAWALRLGRRDVSYMCVPLFHVTFVHFLSTYYVGVPTLLSERVRSAEIVDAIVARGATHTTLVQAALVDLLAHLEEHPVDLPKMTTLQYGGSPIAPAVIERVCDRFGEVLHQNYGSTEAGGAVTVLPPEDHSPARLGAAWRERVASAGHAMPGTEIAVVGPNGEPLPAGEVGDIRLRSDSVMDRYWGNETATREVLLDGGWLATGDVGRLDTNGYLTIVDRKKDIIISGGENIYARDVEDILLAHPAVQEAAVVGGPNPRLGEEVVAYVVPRDGAELSQATLLGWVTERLARYKKPARIIFEESLPRTPVGKIHKPTLRARLRDPADQPRR
jgi:acyl-CoA synthetase (AMP-forming)/AMP-acid ligase II